MVLELLREKISILQSKNDSVTKVIYAIGFYIAVQSLFGPEGLFEKIFKPRPKKGKYKLYVPDSPLYSFLNPVRYIFKAILIIYISGYTINWDNLQKTQPNSVFMIVLISFQALSNFISDGATLAPFINFIAGISYIAEIMYMANAWNFSKYNWYMFCLGVSMYFYYVVAHLF